MSVHFLPPGAESGQGGIIVKHINNNVHRKDYMVNKVKPRPILEGNGGGGRKKLELHTHT